MATIHYFYDFYGSSLSSYLYVAYTQTLGTNVASW